MLSHYDIIAEEKQNDSVDQIPVEDIESVKASVLMTIVLEFRLY